MVCPKLHRGGCKATKRRCRAKYMVKMRHHKNCKHYKPSRTAKKARKKVIKHAKKKKKRR